MSKVDKAIIIFLGGCILFGVLKSVYPKKNKNEIVIDGYHFPKAPCVSAMNEFFGKGADSSKICDCLLPGFYQLIKHDAALVHKFRQTGVYKLESTLNDSAGQILRNCVVNNILDTNYYINLRKFKEPFLERLNHQVRTMPDWQVIDIDRYNSCLERFFDLQMTIKEYFAEDYTKIDKINSILLSCSAESVVK